MNQSKKIYKKNKKSKFSPDRNLNCRTKKGGEVIGYGGYGCIFKPALRCENSDTRVNGVSKLLLNRDANNEWKELNIVKNIIKQIPNNEKYFLLNNLQKCKPNTLTDTDKKNIKKCSYPLINFNVNTINNNLHQLQIINMPYGGYDLAHIIHNNMVSLYILNYFLIKLLKNAILPMNKLGLYHFDLKSANMLYDKQLRIIDWGLSGVSSLNTIIPVSNINKNIQFNTPFSRILFTSYFDDFLYKNLSNYELDYNNSDNLFKNLRAFMMDYYERWKQVSRGSGHEKYINEYIFPEIYKLVNLDYPKSENIVSSFIASYCAKILMKYVNFKTKQFNKNLYFTEVYSKNVDIWGFLSSYLPFIITSTYLKRDKINIANILIHYCYSNNYATKPINTDQLIVDLIDLTNIETMNTVPKLNLAKILPRKHAEIQKFHRKTNKAIPHKRKRCPNGQRKNRKTGRCEPKNKIK